MAPPVLQSYVAGSDMPSEGMKETNDSTRSKQHGQTQVGSVLLCILSCLILVVMAWVSPVVREVYAGMHLPANWRTFLCVWPGFSWAIPFALFLSPLLILKDRSVSRRAAYRLNVIVLAFILVFFLLWLFAVLSPVFVTWEIGTKK